MNANLFWLIVVEDSQVTVALISRQNQPFSVAATGPSTPWQDGDDSLITAVDSSLSQCATNAQLTEIQEPSTVALVVPPSWVGPDSRIVEFQLKSIETLCKRLRLRPMGFISSEEAIVEEANTKEGIPASFISLHISPSNFTLSLVYLGKIKKIITRQIDSSFGPALIEAVLIDLHSESALPPLIKVWGQIDSSVLQSLQEYPWVGKKDVETFLHLPEITYRPISDMIRTFAQAIVFQIEPGHLPPPAPDTIPESQVAPPPPPPQESPELPAEIDEVTPDEFGFNSGLETVSSPPVIDEVDPVQPFPSSSPPPPSPPRFKLPPIHLSLPKINFRLPQIGYLLLPIPLVLLFSFLILLLLSTAQITIYVSPLNFQKDIPVTLSTTDSSINASTIPVQLKTVNVEASESLPTTGKKTIGDYAKGEIVIYNKQEKAQTIPKGSILLDTSGRKFELVNSVQVASSSSDFNQGIITLGQVKTQVQATDIGPESNISSQSKLTFKDFTSTLLVAKANQTFTGGSRQEIAAVLAIDKQNLENKINTKIKDDLATKINQDVDQTAGLIADSIRTQKSRLDYNREVGEAADNLSATATATISVFVFDESRLASLLSNFLSSDPGYAQADIDPSNFTASFKISKLSNTQASAIMTIQGTALPKTDLPAIQRLLPAKGFRFAQNTIKNKISRAYNIDIQPYPSLLQKIDLLPLIASRISLSIKTKP